MKKFVTLLLCMLPVSLFAQVNDGIRQAMDNYDYETVVSRPLKYPFPANSQYING